MKKAVLISIILISTTGCITFGGKKEPTFTYPSDITPMCEQAKERAIQIIQTHGVTPITNRSVTVKKHKGDRFIRGMWAWDIGDGYYVGGSIKMGNIIEVGCNPITGGEVSFGVLQHEMGHYLLGIYSHPAEWNDLFGYVDEVARVTDIVVMDEIDRNGNVVLHMDLVR